MKKRLLALLAASLAPALGNADTGKCIPRIEQFRDVDQLIGYEGRCLEALAMGEDRTQECGGLVTSIIHNDGKRMFTFESGEKIRLTYVGMPNVPASVGSEQHYTLQEFMISNSDKRKAPFVGAVDPGAACVIRSANHSAHELQCSATLSALQFTFSNSFKATAAPEIDNICK